jgi:hypothetical protein
VAADPGEGVGAVAGLRGIQGPDRAERSVDSFPCLAVVDLGEDSEPPEFSTYSWVLESTLSCAGFDILERSFRRSAYGIYTCRRRGSRRRAQSHDGGGRMRA